MTDVTIICHGCAEVFTGSPTTAVRALLDHTDPAPDLLPVSTVGMLSACL